MKQNMLTIYKDIRTYSLKQTPRIFFCHVPKCAGGSIARAISNSYTNIEKLLTKKFHINLYASDVAYKICSKDMMEVREAIMCYYLNLPKYTYGRGHTRCLPQIVKEFRPTWDFVTMLRNPVDRWISEYVYNMYSPKKVPGRNQLSMGVSEYLRSDQGRLAGIRYLYYFSNIKGIPSSNDNIYINEALKNLRQFSVVGTIEELDQWVSRFKNRYKRNIVIPRTNPSPKPEIGGDIYSNKKLIDQIRAACNADIKLYENLCNIKDLSDK